MRCGFVSIVGRPNVGKSTLLNNLIGEKLAITSPVSGTTRNIINGIYNDDDSQIIFIDTPGIHKPKHKLDNLLNKKSYDNFYGVDIILFLIDAESGYGRGDEFILDKIKDIDAKKFIILNKIDKIKDKSKIIKVIDDVKDKYDFDEIIPISALKDTSELLKEIKKYLPVRNKIYEDEDFTNVSTRFIMSEYVREKLLLLTHDEIPHSISCYTEYFKDRGKTVDIKVLIVVDRDNIKKIVIGKGGSLLKKVGIEARRDMEKFLGKKVMLETYVKTIDNWRDEVKYFKELGLDDEDN